MLKPNDNVGEILERHEEKIEAFEKIFLGLISGIAMNLFIAPKIKKVLQVLQKFNKIN